MDTHALRGEGILPNYHPRSFREVIQLKILGILERTLEIPEVSLEQTFGEIGVDVMDLLDAVHQIRTLVGRFDLLEGWLKQLRTSREIEPIRVAQLVSAVVDDQTVNVAITTYFEFSAPVKMGQRFADFPVQVDSIDVFAIIEILREIYQASAVYSEDELHAMASSRQKVGDLTGEAIAMRITAQTGIAAEVPPGQELQAAAV